MGHPVTGYRACGVSGPFLLLFLCLFAAGLPNAYAETVSWRNPLTYADSSAIPAAVRATIETRLYYSPDRAAWTRFATVSGGAESWTGTLPSPDGITGYYAATTTVPPDGVESPFSNIVSYPPSSNPVPEAVSGTFDETSVSVGNYQDTFVAFGDNANRSSDPLIRTYVWPVGKVANRGFLKWDLSSLPADAEVTGATLRLYHADEDGIGGDNVLAVSVSKVVGADPDLGMATWDAPGPALSWTGGADGGARNLAARESTAGVGKTHGWVVWNVTGMVRDWMNTPGSNLGMALEPDQAGTVDSNRYFASREHPDPLLRPELLVSYRLPVPGPLPGISTVPSPPSVPDAAADISLDEFTVSVAGLEDTYVNSGFPDGNYSLEPLIATYTWPANRVANRGFLRWDLSGLPENIAVTNAALWLHYVAGGAGGDDTYTVNVAGVTGVLPDPGHATWNRFNGLSPWPGGQNGGAAAIGTPASSATIGRTYRWVSWDVTDLVQGWITRPETRFGMVLDGDASAGVDSNRFFASGEFPDPLLRPRLLITYIKGR